MQARSDELSAFLNTLALAVYERAKPNSHELLLMTNIMQALKIDGPSVRLNPTWLPVCDLIESTVNAVVAHCSSANSVQQLPSSVSLIDHAQALLNLASQLAWWRRIGDEPFDSPFITSHANATVVGRGGLEERDDVWIGISLLAPGVQYPKHCHPPEEAYLVLSPGEWQKEGGHWFEPGIGGLVYNEPNVYHSMRSGAAPLLATWCLLK